MNARYAFVMAMLLSDPAAAQVCAIAANGVSSSSLSFGTVSGLGAQPGSSGLLGVSCISSPVAYTVALNYGSGAGANGLHRYMTSPSGATVPYHLYTDPAYQHVWGDSTGVNTVSSTYNGTLQIFTIYADVLSVSGAAPGTYTDYETSNLVYSGGNASFQFAVTVTVAAACNVSATALNFGSVSAPIATAVTSTATVTTQCTNTTPYSIGLDSGTNAAGSQRRMQQGAAGQYVSYNLFTDSGYAQPWGAASSATGCAGASGTCVLGTGTGSNQGITVYGQVPPQASPSVGSYTDTVVVTVTY
jgi:spore coat protein U-like protein